MVRNPTLFSVVCLQFLSLIPALFLCSTPGRADEKATCSFLAVLVGDSSHRSSYLGSGTLLKPKLASLLGSLKPCPPPPLETSAVRVISLCMAPWCKRDIFTLDM